MQLSYQTPGVYREDVVLRAPPPLATGVPGFAGFGSVVSGAGPVALEHASQIADQLVLDPAASWLTAVLNSFFDNGGVRCYVACADTGAIDRPQALIDALETFASLEDLDLLATPDATRLQTFDGQLDQPAALRVQQAAISQCVRLGNRLALLDAWPGVASDSVLAQRAALGLGVAEPVSAALYYPWPLDANKLAFPPCGAVAGVIAATDAAVGVYKAPANRPLAGVLDLEVQVDDGLQAMLHPNGVNCLRAFPGRGIRIWGARTLSRDPAWQQISVRRLFLTLGRWIDANMGWATFEPNTPVLWASVERVLEAYLDRLWRAGAMFGATADQAYYVRCNADNNPPAAQDNGWLVTEIGLAPTQPAEFVVVRVTLRVEAP